MPGRKGQGGEGLSDGYGGSAGDGTGASGPEAGKRSKPEDDAELQKKINRDEDYSPSLPVARNDRRACCAEAKRRVVRALAEG